MCNYIIKMFKLIEKWNNDTMCNGILNGLFIETYPLHAAP